MRTVSGRHPFCSPICSGLHAKMAELQGLAEALGSSETITAAWVALVEASDTWTQFQTADYEMFKALRDLGYSSDEINALRGQTARGA